MHPLNSPNPVLTISILCSGRFDTLRNCLDSLKTLRERVPSELVLTDTANDPEQTKILEEYTDIILPFEWCRDFAKARNVGLEAAKGQWFLYIDDDEWFIDTVEIEDFFLSGKADDPKLMYGAVKLFQRNYITSDGKHYDDDPILRLFKIQAGVRFICKIHEYPSPLNGNCYIAHSYLHHYGYIYVTEEEEREHHRRNIVLLEEGLKEERRSLQYWIHYVQEFYGYDDNRLAESCKDAINVFKKDDTFDINRGRGTFYNGYLIGLLKTGKWDQAYRVYNDAVFDKRNLPLAQAALYYRGIKIYDHRNDYMNCIDVADKFFKIRESLLGDEDTIINSGFIFVQEAMDPRVANDITSLALRAAMKLGKWERFYDFWNRIDWNHADEHHYFDLCTELLDNMVADNGGIDWSQIARGLLSNDKPKGRTLELIAQKELLSKKDKDKVSDFERFVDIFGQCEDKQFYVIYLNIMYCDRHGLVDKLYGYYDKLLSCVTDFLELDECIFDIAIKHHVDLDTIMRKIKFSQWKQGMDSFCAKSSMQRLMQRKDLMEYFVKGDDVRYRYLDMKFAEAIAWQWGVNKESGLPFNELHKMISEFADKTLLFYRGYFKDSAFEGEMEMLPENAKFSVKWKAVEKAEDSGSISDVKEALKECLGIYPEYNDMVKNYTEGYAAMKKEEVEKSRISPEMEALGKQIKAKIRELIDAGQFLEADNVFSQLKSMIGMDSEMEELQKLIY